MDTAAIASHFIESAEEVSAPDAGPTNTGPRTIPRTFGVREAGTNAL